MLDLKQTARDIFQRSLASIDIPATLARKLGRAGSRIRCGDAVVDLAEFQRIVAIVFGKAGFAMADGLLHVLAPDFSARGVLVVPAAPPRCIGAPPRELPGFRTFVAGHPVPTAASFAAAEAILELLAGCDARTLVFFLLSGGASALVEKPLFPDITLDDTQALHRTLVTCGAPIDEINAVRKHLSAVKGGRLAAAAPRAMKVTLGVSDVPEGRESALGSGPTLPDPTTVQDALRVVRNYGLLDKLPTSIRAKCVHPEALPETPKPDDPAFARARFQPLLGLRDLFEHARRWAEAADFVTICDNTTDDWPLARAAEFLLDQLAQLKAANPTRRVAVIADGELSSPVTGDGIGGRNSAFVLDCVEKIAGKPIAVLSAGTDGVDGNSPAAGGVADGSTLARARAAGLDPQDHFRRSDAYTFFRQLGDAIETGPTGNNLRDLRILLAD
jgi:hydroxypyruvate reductase